MSYCTLAATVAPPKMSRFIIRKLTRLPGREKLMPVGTGRRPAKLASSLTSPDKKLTLKQTPECLKTYVGQDCGVSVKFGDLGMVEPEAFWTGILSHQARYADTAGWGYDASAPVVSASAPAAFSLRPTTWPWASSWTSK